VTAEYLTPQDVAALLQVDDRTVLRWAASDPSMPTLRIGRVVRFEKAALDRWLVRKRPRTIARGATCRNT
jgi:excisionase family DNA binding protein